MTKQRQGRYAEEAAQHAAVENCGPCQWCGKEINYEAEADDGQGQCPMCGNAPACPIELPSGGAA